ncbi:MAG: hypothetical protein J7M25_16005 [Deltaproteobacteria bacterium]|nr:hypothetical protein [Deltaproteobacteria bacterium]
MVQLKDVTLREALLTDRIEGLRRIYFDTIPEICVERPRLITQFHLEHGLLGQEGISSLDKARAYRFVLEHREPIVYHTNARRRDGSVIPVEHRSLLAGSTTSKYKGVPMYPELLALTLWPELDTVSHRGANPYYLSERDAQILNEEVFPHWMDWSVLEVAQKGFKGAGFRLLQKLVFFLASKPTCISHTIPDFSRAVREGLRGIIEDARKRQGRATKADRDFYRAVEEALEGIISYSRRLAEQAERMAAVESDDQTRKDLEEIVAVHRRVPEFGATSFREAVTTVWMCWVAVHLENANIGLSLGRLDQLFYEFYRKDLEAKRITVQGAAELLSNLWLKIGDHVPMVPKTGEQLFGGSGSNQAITIGGVDRDGKDAVNDVTYLILRTIELMLLRDPNLNARYMTGVNSDTYLRRLCQVNVSTKATPAIHNDRAAIHALTAKGETLEQARDYGVVGCVEPCSAGRHYGHSGALLINLTSALELALFNGRHRHTGPDEIVSMETGAFESFGNYDDFLQAFRDQVEWLAEQAVETNNQLGRAHQAFYPTPILSSLFEGPMAKGKDLIEGGATINSSGATIIGFSDVVDSLAAIRHWVFEQKSVSAQELIEALHDNFKDRDALAARLANPEQTPKFGNEDPTAEQTAKWLVTAIDEIFGSHENYRGGRYRVGYWTMTNHAGFGRITGATPNGRLAGQNFASGITPVSRETPALTPVLNSVGSLPSARLANGVALNIKYTPNHGAVPPLDDPMISQFAATVQAYFDPTGGSSATGADVADPSPASESDVYGGMEIQFNITDHETFMEAVQDPAQFRELLVRVSGYTAYFKDLNPQMQKEIIDRTEYELASGKAVPFPPYELPFSWRVQS